MEFTDALSGEKYVSVSYVKPVLHLFKHEILKSQDDESPLTRTIKEGFLNYLNDKYDDVTTEKLLDMATLLDPQFKNRLQKGRENQLHEDKSCCRNGAPGGWR